MFLLDKGEHDRLKKLLCLNEQHHGWDLSEVMKYLAFFLPLETVLRPKDAQEILRSLDIPADYVECSNALYWLSQNDGPFILERLRFPEGTVGETYRFKRPKRQEFESERLHNAKLILEEPEPEPEAREISQSLAEIVSQIQDRDEREFAEEAAKCLRFEAYRAAIVMGWNLAYDHLRNWLVKHGLATFNGVLTTKWRNRKQGVQHTAVSTVEDLNDHKERFVVDLCREAGLLDHSEYRALDHGLNNRNAYAHPSGAHVGPAIAAGHLDDLIRHIVNNVKFRL